VRLGVGPPTASRYAEQEQGSVLEKQALLVVKLKPRLDSAHRSARIFRLGLSVATTGPKLFHECRRLRCSKNDGVAHATFNSPQPAKPVLESAERRTLCPKDEKVPSLSKVYGGGGRSRTYDTADMSRML
jgi:hypothetical protein